MYIKPYKMDARHKVKEYVDPSQKTLTHYNILAPNKLANLSIGSSFFGPLDQWIP